MKLNLLVLTLVPLIFISCGKPEGEIQPRIVPDRFIIDGTNFGIDSLADITYSEMGGSLSLGVRLPGDGNKFRNLPPEEARKWSWLKSPPFLQASAIPITNTKKFCVEMNDALYENHDHILVLQGRRRIYGKLCFENGVLQIKGIVKANNRDLVIDIETTKSFKKSKLFSSSPDL